MTAEKLLAIGLKTGLSAAESWAATPGEISDIYAYQAILAGVAEESAKIRDYDEAMSLR